MATRKGSDNIFPLVRLSYEDDTPPTPPTGQGQLVAGADKLLRWIDDEGTLYNLATPGAPAEITDSGTAETDDTLVLAPDGVGGVEWRAEAGGGTPPAELGYDDLTSTFNTTSTSLTDVTGLSTTVTIGSRPVVVEVYVHTARTSNTADGRVEAAIVEGSTVVQRGFTYSDNGSGHFLHMRVRRAPAAGSLTYKVQVRTLGAGTVDWIGAADAPSFIRVHEV